MPNETIRDWIFDADLESATLTYVLLLVKHRGLLHKTGFGAEQEKVAISIKIQTTNIVFLSGFSSGILFLLLHFGHIVVVIDFNSVRSCSHRIHYILHSGANYSHC